MRTPVVVETNPVSNGAARILRGLEPLPVHALLLQDSDYPFDHAVLLGAMRRDELMFQTVAANQFGIAMAGEDEQPRCCGMEAGFNNGWSQGTEVGCGGGAVRSSLQLVVVKLAAASFFLWFLPYRHLCLAHAIGSVMANNIHFLTHGHLSPDPHA